MPTHRSKARNRKPPARSREGGWKYSDKKASITQPLPEFTQTTQAVIRPTTAEEFPQSKEDAIKALSQLLLNRAKVKNQAS